MSPPPPLLFLQPRSGYATRAARAPAAVPVMPPGGLRSGAGIGGGGGGGGPGFGWGSHRSGDVRAAGSAQDLATDYSTLRDRLPGNNFTFNISCKCGLDCTCGCVPHSQPQSVHVMKIDEENLVNLYPPFYLPILDRASKISNLSAEELVIISSLLIIIIERNLAGPR